MLLTEEGARAMEPGEDRTRIVERTVHGYRVFGAGSMHVRTYPGGPTLVRDAVAVIDRDEVIHEVRRPVVALCRCDRSRLEPWCDGVHRFVREMDAGTDAAPPR
jgi:CDGSH-type Zn-finger protein